MTSLIIFVCSLLASKSSLFVLSAQIESQLIDYVLSKSHKLTRPVESPTDILTVNVSLELIQLIRVDEKSQILTTNVLQSVTWQDVNLVWNVSKYGNISQVRVSMDRIWHPDVLLYNTADASTISKMGTSDSINCFITSVSSVTFLGFSMFTIFVIFAVFFLSFIFLQPDFMPFLHFTFLFRTLS